MKARTKTILKWWYISWGIIILVGLCGLGIESEAQTAERAARHAQEAQQAAVNKLDKAKAKESAIRAKIEADKQAAIKAEYDRADENGIIMQGATATEITECQYTFKNELYNPKSMNISFMTQFKDVKLDDPNQYSIMFEFYAKNQYNADVRHIAKCIFNKSNKELQSLKVEDTSNGLIILEMAYSEIE